MQTKTEDAKGMKAVILAGGKGTRLQPFTVNFPKPLMPLGDRPILEVLIRHLLKHGVSDITLTLGHLAELVKAFFDHRSELTRQIQLHTVEEEEPVGTAGSISLVPNLNETFLVMNGDLLTDMDLHDLVRFHRQQESLLTIATHTREVQIDFGLLKLDEQNQVVDYEEKPSMTHHVSMGIYVYEPEVVSYIPRGEYLDFPDLVLRLLEEGKKVSAYPADCLWLDIGRADDYARAQQLYETRQEEPLDRV